MACTLKWPLLPWFAARWLTAAALVIRQLARSARNALFSGFQMQPCIPQGSVAASQQLSHVHPGVVGFSAASCQKSTWHEQPLITSGLRAASRTCIQTYRSPGPLLRWLNTCATLLTRLSSTASASMQGQELTPGPLSPPDGLWIRSHCWAGADAHLACWQAEPLLSRTPQGKMPALVNAFRQAATQSSAAEDPLHTALKLRYDDSSGSDSHSAAGPQASILM